MLLNALLCAALLASIALTVVTAGFAMTRAAVTRAAQTASVAAYRRAAGVVYARLSDAMRTGTPLPAFTPLPDTCEGSRCAFTTSATIALRAPGAPRGCTVSGDACARNEESNPYVDEGRVVARIVVAVKGADGSTLSTRERDLTFRTFRTPPYVAAAAASDDTLDAFANPPGDDGGAPPATPNPCASSGPASASGTAVRVVYVNAADQRCTNASAWRDAAYPPATGP